MDINQILALKKSREEEHRKDMEAIDRMIRMLSGASRIDAPVRGDVAQPPVEKPNITLPEAVWKTSPTKAVRMSIELVPDEFTINDVREALSKRWPSVAQSAGVLSPALRRIAEDKIIEVVSKGAGSAPTVYRKVKHNPLFSTAA